MTYTRVSTRAAVTNPAPVLMTAEELMTNPVPNMRTELVGGRLQVCEPPGYRHGDVAARVLVAIGTHLANERRNLGWSKLRGRLLAAETGFTLQRNPDTVRAPDVAYVRAERVPTEDLPGYAEFAPDLVVEVRSPSDRTGMVLAKVADWLNAGTMVVWTIDPALRVARVYRADGGESMLDATESLSGEDVLPGLVIPLSDLFD